MTRQKSKENPFDLGPMVKRARISRASQFEKIMASFVGVEEQ